MNMKKMIFAMGAVLAAVVGASPASATVYQYTVHSGEVLTINTSTQIGRLVGNGASLTFSSASFANFTGGAKPNFSGTFSSVSGSLWWPGGVANITTVGTPRFEFNPNSGPAGSWILRDVRTTFLNSDAQFNITSYVVNPPQPDPQPVTVPEPAMLGLFGAGAVMVMMGRRRRSVAKSVAGTGKLALA